VTAAGHLLDPEDVPAGGADGLQGVHRDVVVAVAGAQHLDHPLARGELQTGRLRGRRRAGDQGLLGAPEAVAEVGERGLQTGPDEARLGQPGPGEQVGPQVAGRDPDRDAGREQQLAARHDVRAGGDPQARGDPLGRRLEADEEHPAAGHQALPFRLGDEQAGRGAHARRRRQPPLHLHVRSRPGRRSLLAHPDSLDHARAGGRPGT
jgi:hypothetical protein